MEPEMDYIKGMTDRFNQLTQDEVSSLLSLYGTPELIVISQVLGPEVSQALGSSMNEAALAVGSRDNLEPSPPQMPQPQEQVQPRRMGLGSR